MLLSDKGEKGRVIEGPERGPRGMERRKRKKKGEQGWIGKEAEEMYMGRKRREKQD